MFINTERKLFFEPTVNTISRVLNLPASIWLLDEAENSLKMEAATKVLDKLMRDAPPLDLNKPCVTAKVFKTRKTHIVEDIKSEKKWQYKNIALKMNFKSAVIVPLLIKKKIEGILYLYIPENEDFHYGGKHVIIDSFAEQIASTYRQIRSLEMLNEVSRLISSELQNLNILFKHTMQSAQKVLDSQHVSIFLLDKESGDLVLEATSSSDLKRKRFKPGEGLAGHVIQSGDSMLVSDVRKHPKFVDGLTAPGISERSMLLVPIKLESRIVGIISANMDGLDGFDKHDNMLLEALASQTAIAIRNANYIQQINRQAEALTELNVLAQHLISVEEYPDPRNLLYKIAASAKEVLRADLIELYEYKKNQKKYGLPPISVGEKLDRTVIANKIYKDNTVWQVLERSKPLYEKNSQAKSSVFMTPYTIERENLPMERFVIREKIKSTAAIPFRTGDESMGLMFANYRLPQTFGKEQRELIELFANQAAIAIKNAELLEKYIEARAYLENIIVNSPDPIIVLDENGNIKIFNKACEELWGFTTGEVKGKHVTNYYESEAHARELGKKLWKSEHHRIENVEARIRTRNDEVVPIRLSASFLFNDEEKRIGSVGVFTDLRELKRLEEEKIQAEQLAALGKLAHTVGHDLKHDIGTVLFYTDTLLQQQNNKKDAKLLKVFTNIKDALWDATDKLQNMLLAGQPKIPQKEILSMEDIFLKLIKQMLRQANNRDIEFLVKYPEEKHLLSIDPEQMKQVFSNLFTNSIYAIELQKNNDPSFKKGRIKVSAGINNGCLTILWQDNGIGISKEDSPKIFNAFYTNKQFNTGTGLGLFIVKTIVENHEGNITVNSKLGEGTCFEITLPIIKTNKE